MKVANDPPISNPKMVQQLQRFEEACTGSGVLPFEHPVASSVRSCDVKISLQATCEIE